MNHLKTLDITLAIWSQIASDREIVDNETVVALLQPLKAVRAVKFTVTLAQEVDNDLRTELGCTPYLLFQRSRPGIGYYHDLWDD